jgi:hypothetical protein
LGIIENVVNGSMDYGKGMVHLRSLVPQVKNKTDLANAGSFMRFSRRSNFPVPAKVYDFLFKEIIGKRALDCDKFFVQFLAIMFQSLEHLAVKKESVDEYLNVLKDCLKWRFVVRDSNWRQIILTGGAKGCERAGLPMICVLDETIRDIMFRKKFRLNNDYLSIITRWLRDEGCSVRFRLACEKILFSNNWICESSVYLDVARKACQERDEKQSIQKNLD